MFAASKSGRSAAGGGATDASFAYVPLLLETTSTNGQQNNTFLDSSTNAFTITRNGTATQGSFTPYRPNGYWSNYFNGTSDYLSVANNAAFELGANNFTIEAWIQTTSSVQYTTIAAKQVASATGNWWFLINNASATAGDVAFWCYDYNLFTTAMVSTSGVNVRDGLWHHIALVRNGSSWAIYVDGVSRGTLTIILTIGSLNASLYVGNNQQNPTKYFPGYISNFRLVNGTAVYTTGFTPSTTPLTATQSANVNGNPSAAITGTQTSLLTCQSNRFIDNSTNNFAITLAGTPRVQAFQPFSPTASYTTALYGGSGYFNGSTDYLSITDGSALQLGSGNFTIEGWVYCPAVSGNNSIYSRNLFGMLIGISSSNFTFFASSNGSSWNLASGITFGAATSNTWAHFAAVRNGTNITLYLNGVLGNTVAVSTNALYEVTAPTVGYWTSGGASWYLNGYVSNLRVVKGTAVYTGAFKPPTLAPLTTLGTTSAASYTDTTNVNTTFTSGTGVLLNMTNAGIYDAAMQNDITTAGAAQASISQYKWSPTSMSFNGSTSYAQALSNPAFTLGASNFTIEFWVYFNSVASGQSVAGRHVLTAAGDWAIYTASTGSLNYYLSSTGATWNLANQISIGSISTGTWYYVALVRNGSVFTPYIGTTPGSTPTAGTTTTTSSALFATTQALTIGAANNSAGYFNGYVQDFRFTVGVARSITTVPSAAFPTK